MFRKNVLFLLVVFCVLLSYMAEKCFAEVSVGNASVSIYAGTNPLNEFSSVTLYDQEDAGIEIAVKLPGRTQSYFLSHPGGFLPGWSASKAQDSNTVTVISPDNLKYIYTEAFDHTLAVIKNANDANVVVFDYNSVTSRIDKQIDSYDSNLYIEYDYNDTTGYLETLTLWDENNNESREYLITYDANGMVTAAAGSCGCGGGGFKFEYNDDGKLLRTKTADDDIIYEYAYDSNSLLTDKYLGPISGGNHVQKISYSGSSYVDIKDYVDANSYRLIREYRNSRGQATKRIRFEDLNEDPNDPNNDSFAEYVVYYYDANNNVTKKVAIPPSADSGDPDPGSITGIRKEYTYDPNTGSLLAGKWYSSTDANFTVASYTYNYIWDDNEIINVQTITSTDAREAITEYFYDGNSIDPNLKVMPEVTVGISGTQQLKNRYTYDPNRNWVTLEQQLDGSNNVIAKTEYEYDYYGNLVKRYDYYDSTDSNEVTEYQYNGFNENIRMTSSSGIIQGWSYNDDGKVEYEVIYDPCDPNYVYSQTSYYYDVNGRVEMMAKAKHSGKFALDSGPDNWIWTEYEYDLRGNKTKVTEDVNMLNLETTYEYNNQGEVVKVTLPTGKWTETVRDGRGLVATTKVGHGSTTVATTTFEYDANGNLKWKTAPDGKKIRYDYDDFDRVILVTKGL